MKNRTLNAFTIIELLVIVIILALLLAIAAFSYTKSLGRSRDARRAKDVEAIYSAAELYKQIHNYYPDKDTTCTGRGAGQLFVGSYCNGTAWPATANIQSLVTEKLISSLPLDPINNQVYQYLIEINPNLSSGALSCSSISVPCAYIVVYANFENQTDPNNFAGYCATNYNSADLSTSGWLQFCKNKQ